MLAFSTTSTISSLTLAVPGPLGTPLASITPAEQTFGLLPGDARALHVWEI
jgi:hypothetical protein